LRVPLVAVGLREPYSLIVSTVWLTQLADDELTFLVGRELGHIYARHTRLTSLLSSAGSDNPILGFVMGPWLRRTEYTADRVGLLCCGESNAATRAILTTQFQNVANAIDPKAFLEQREEIEGDSSLRIGEWISREPYATHRIHQLRSFEASALFAYWREKLKAYARVVNPVTYRERNRTALLAVLLLDGALIVSLANYLHVSKAIVVNATDLNVPTFLHLAAKHGTWLGGLLGPHPSAEALSDALTTAASFILSLIVYSGIAVVLHGTPGMLVFSVGRRNLGTTKN
jgi:hypothetical protein